MIDVKIRLRRAILTDDIALVQRIIVSNPKYIRNDDPDDHGNTSLHTASKLGYYTTAAFLVDAGHEEDMISRNYEGQTPLHLSTTEEMVHFLASTFPRCIDWKDKTGKTALMLAATQGHDPIVNILIDFGALMDEIDLLGNTPLHYASAYGHLKTMRSLIDRGASIDKINRKGWTPRSYSYSMAAEQYFVTLTRLQMDEKKRLMSVDTAAARTRGITPAISFERPRAATPLERTSFEQMGNRPRASSGS